MEQQMKNNTTVEGNKKLGPVLEYDAVGSLSSSSSSLVSSTNSSGSSSLESDSFDEEVTSPSSSSSSSSSSSADHHQLAHDPLSDMSSLFQQLPIKRGLSKHYQGKSQSFTSLANVRSLEDLAKAENPYNKKLKYSRSFGGGLGESQRGKCTPSAMSRHVPKRGMHSNSRGSCSSLSARRASANNFMGSSRPPIPPHRSTSTSTIPNQTALFA